MKTNPFHSIEPSANVYHDNTSCVDGNNIETKYKRAGTANRPRCTRCSSL